MKDTGIDSAKLNAALEKYGSLEKANSHLEEENAALKQRSQHLKEEIDQLLDSRNRVVGNLMGFREAELKVQAKLKAISEQLQALGAQYELFCAFMTMVAGSPSVSDSIDAVVVAFQRLREPGWTLPKDADQLRSFFVRTVMGDFLKSFRCGACGTKFLANRKPVSSFPGTGYRCPVCHRGASVEVDDSFLKALVSGKQLDEVYHAEALLKENETLKPFKAFVDATCEICHQPIKTWDDFSVSLAMQGAWCGHTSCWNSDVGAMRMIGKRIQKMQKEGK